MTVVENIPQNVGSESIGGGGELLISFSSLLAEETHRLFGQGVRGYVAWSSILSSSLLLPIFLIYLFISAYGANRAGNRFRIGILVLIIAVVPVIVAPFGIRPNTRPNSLDSNIALGTFSSGALPGQSQENQHCLIEAD